MTSCWDPDRYLRFQSERRQPFDDLVALVEARPNMRVVDLGCGPGELTADLAQRLNVASVTGVDISDTMLARAQAYRSDRVQFEHADLATHPIGEGLDLVFSNAALHWLPDHGALFGRLRAALGPTGQLAVQMPANFEQPTHAVAVEVAADARFADALEGRRSGAAVESAERYATLLYDLGFARQIVRQAIYLHVLPGPEAVVEWVQGSLLTWYAARLGPELHAEFERDYRERLLSRLPDRRPFPFTYRRTLLWASLDGATSSG